MRIWLPVAVQLGLMTEFAAWRHFGDGRWFGDALPAPTLIVADGWPLLSVVVIGAGTAAFIRSRVRVRRFGASLLFAGGLAVNALSAWALTLPFTSLLPSLHR